MNENLQWHRASISDKEIAAVTRVLRSGCLAAGPETEAFEAEFATFVGRRHAIAVSSGTGALQLILAALDLRDDAEVILPSLTFVACASAVLHSGATPVFADVDPTTLTLDPLSVKHAISARTRAILGVDLFGTIADWEQIARAAGAAALVEDACQALGSSRRGRPAGSFGHAAAFSFFPNKLVTTGEGGMVCLDDDGMAQRLRRLRSQGRLLSDPAGVHLEIGYNFRMTEIQSALGRTQLSRLRSLLAKRSELAETYHHYLRGLHDWLTPLLPPEEPRGWFAYPVRLAPSVDVDRVIAGLQQRGIPAKRTYIPIHQQPAYVSLTQPPVGLDVTEAIGPRIVSLPFFTDMTVREVQRVVAGLEAVLR